jgi:ribosomal protein S18 acetylase RimI-like enzyme
VPQQVVIEGPPFSSRVAARGGVASRRRQWGDKRGTASRVNRRVLRRDGEQAFVRPFGEDQPTVHLLAPGNPSPSFLRWCLEQLSAGEGTRVLTGALAPGEEVPFLEAGFTVVEHLSLLERELSRTPGTPGRSSPSRNGYRRGDWALRRARQSDRPLVLSVDHAAFEPFWQLDDESLDEALAATPDRRFRVAVRSRVLRGSGREVAAYAVTGLAFEQGYIQRLAVHPVAQGKGAGRALLADGLRWLERKGAARVVVNTQESNERALALYERFGFQRSSGRLSVLCADVTGRSG